MKDYVNTLIIMKQISGNNSKKLNSASNIENNKLKNQEKNI